MNDKRKQGIYIPANKTFYYLETGPHFVSSEIERLRNILTQRGHVLFNTGLAEPGERLYEVITLHTAKEKERTIEVIYLNAHVESTFKNSPASKKESGGWT
jgi:hypothetical protein